MSDDAKVYFWSLRQKFVDSDDDIPEQAQQVMYYSLAIGHHVGMIDCLKTELVCPLEKYQAWIDLLALAFDPIAKSDDPLFSEWSQTLINLLGEIVIEPAIYLIVKRKP